MQFFMYECRHGLTRLALVLLVVLSPFSMAQACSKSGKLAGLVQCNDGDLATTLDDDPAVQVRLQHLPTRVRAHLKRNLAVRGPVDLVSCHLVLSGNANHMGGEENAILDVNLYSGTVTVALLSHGHITIYLDKDPTAGSGYDAAVPMAVRWWATMAATGFRAGQALPPNAQVEKPGP